MSSESVEGCVRWPPTAQRRQVSLSWAELPRAPTGRILRAETPGEGAKFGRHALHNAIGAPGPIRAGARCECDLAGAWPMAFTARATRLVGAGEAFGHSQARLEATPVV